MLKTDDTFRGPDEAYDRGSTWCYSCPDQNCSVLGMPASPNRHDLPA